MKNARSAIIMMTLLLGVGLLVASCAAPSTGTSGRGPAGPVAAMERPAAGTTDDSLDACLARIPKDASAGQRMFAEGSCRRDAAARQAIEAVPGK